MSDDEKILPPPYWPTTGAASPRSSTNASPNVRISTASLRNLRTLENSTIGGSDFGNIHFENPSVRRVDVPHEVRVVFESFKLELDVDAVDAMVSGFSTVDIKHLKSLVIDSSPIIPFLRENTETIQKVRIASSYCPALSTTDHTGPRESPDPDILKANQTVHSIEITENGFRIISILQRFGHLADWTKLDAILSQAVDGLDHIHTEHPLDVGLIR
ncbi:hypothetical protein C8J57DRAFT_1528447 [Mycena rebaudengoi]|nr:hypothetical protein C8J57DRAFT_1528447 [Mycena rebaudengoi]